MGLFFYRQIKVKENVLRSSICYMVPYRKTKRIKLNKELVLPSNCSCVFCYHGKVYECFEKENVYELNGNSLPKLFKFGGFNSKGNNGYFCCKIWYVPKGDCEVNFKIKKAKLKDVEFGKVKGNYTFSVIFSISDPQLFIEHLIKSFNVRNSKVGKAISHWFIRDVKKWFGKAKFTFSDLFAFTNAFSEELTKNFKKKYQTYGLDVQEISIIDIDAKEEILDNALNQTSIESSIQKKLKKYDFDVLQDGQVIEKSFQMSGKYTINSLKENYKRKKSAETVLKDDSVFEVKTLAGKDDAGNEICDDSSREGKYCLVCGKFVPKDSTFCPYCGNVCK